MRNKQYYIIKGKKIPKITGGKGGCFATGTLIMTPSGDIPIETLKIGDEVFCYSDSSNDLVTGHVNKTFIHYDETVLKINYWGKNQVTVTPNHWYLTDEGYFREVGDFSSDDGLITYDNKVAPITSIELQTQKQIVYNLSVTPHHTYIANGIRVHNKGGGKPGGGGSRYEAPNSLFSTDIAFILIALGEGPVYRINPNGAQDIEINEGTIDDLINLDGDGLENVDLFHTENNTGTLTQQPLGVFGEDVVTPQQFASPVFLKKGNIDGIPRAAVTLQDTSSNRWDSLEFVFVVRGLQTQYPGGEIQPHSLTVKVTVYEDTGTTEIASKEVKLIGKTNVEYAFTINIDIPEDDKSSNGYKFTIEKTSNDSDKSTDADFVTVAGWNEIDEDDQAYPRTALIGYALKSFAEYEGSIPTFTSMQKGLICKVPSNYNQPILVDGEIDWRQLEVPESGSNSYTTEGYRLQKTGSSVLSAINPVIYEGFWDGSFTFAWTQNPVWILYDLLTNSSYGLGIPESYVDKFKFYKIGQYCDAADPTTGEWFGVDGYADGTYRHKPRNQFTTTRETLIGLIESTQIKERRFICDFTLSAQKQVIDIVNQVTTVFRGILIYTGGKITLNVDLPDESPVAIFSEANILKDTLIISGIKETELITGVEVTYIEPSNHFKRETVRIDDPLMLKELSQIENVTQVEAFGVTRRSQAIRFGQYLLASNKFIRRKASFRVSSEGIHVATGDVISLSQRVIGTAWGYGGRVQANSTIGESNVTLEHFTSPAITESVITGNTKPLGLRVIGQLNDRVDTYIISNTSFTASATGNTHSGVDLVELVITGRYSPSTQSFTSNNAFSANNVPIDGDLWTFGEIDVNNIYRSVNDKLFKVTGIEREEGDDSVSIHCSEYISNVYTDSDTLINYVPVKYVDTFSPMVPPPAPLLSLSPMVVRNPSGDLRFDIAVSIITDTTGYPIDTRTELEHAVSTQSLLIEGRE